MKLFSYTSYRWRIALLLCFASALSYIDRNTLAILAPTIQKELNWSDVDYADVTALFVLSYTIMYALSGRFIDRIGTRKGLAWSVGSWSLVSGLHALANTVGQFSVVRFFLGATESGNFPAGVKAISEWFPMKERALAIGIFTAGSSIGAALAVPIVSFVALIWGWRMAFIVTGLLGFIWLYAWLRTYYLPERHKKITEEERDLIWGGSIPAIADVHISESVSVLKLLKKKESWGCFSARIFIDPVVYFLVFWIPKYLQDVHGFTLSELGMTAWLPYAAMGIGTILGGWLPKLLIEKRSWSLNRARKTIMFLASVAIPVFCLSLFGQVSPVSAILIISAIMFSHGLWSNIALVTEIYPKNVQATVTGIGGTLGGLTSVISQKLIGISVSNHSYLPIFLFVGLAYITAFLLVRILIGKLGTIRSI